MVGRAFHFGLGCCLVWACACGPGETIRTGQPPPAPGNASSPTSQTQTFAVRTLLLGETTPMGEASASTWTIYGFDIDHHYTVKDSVNVCRLATAAPRLVQIDGNYGIDNAWGSSVMPLLQPEMETTEPSHLASKWIQAGKGTLEISVTGLSEDAKQNFIGLKAQVFRAGVYPGVPAFDASTSWPVLASSLADGQSLGGGAATVFGAAYSTDGTFVSGATDGVIVLDLGIAGEVPFTLTIHHPIITIALAPPGAALAGTIAGVLDVSELVGTWMNVQSKSLCRITMDAATLKQQLEIDRDILSDGTNAPIGSCTAISIGLGFTAARVANPMAVQPDPAPGDACPH